MKSSKRNVANQLAKQQKRQGKTPVVSKYAAKQRLQLSGADR